MIVHKLISQSLFYVIILFFFILWILKYYFEKYNKHKHTYTHKNTYTHMKREKKRKILQTHDTYTVIYHILLKKRHLYIYTYLFLLCVIFCLFAMDYNKKNVKIGIIRDYISYTFCRLELCPLSLLPLTSNTQG